MKTPDTTTAALPLPEPETSPLRRAYDRTAFADLGIPFDTAMTTERFRICLENLARAMATCRRRQARP